ncbi:MAG TPA: Holliday junction resolvase RuvX [Herpetosiphonaceae bacterium]
MNGRILALDVGDKRIGVATCDPMGIVVRPVGVVQAEPRARALAEIQRIVHDEEAVSIVVGLPLTLRGEEGPQAKRVLDFVEALKGVLTIPFVMRDERYTSVEAQRIIDERSGKRKKQRRGEVDEIAATLILQDYLNELQMQRPAPRPLDEDDLIDWQ